MSGGSALTAAVNPVSGAVMADMKAAKSAKKAQKKQIKSTQQAYMDALDRTRSLNSQGLGYQKQALTLAKTNAAKANKIAAGIGTSATNAVLDREQALKANTQQGLVSRGLYNTSALDSLNRGINSDTNRALTEIMDSVGGTQIQTLQAGSNAQMEALGNLAQYLQSNGIAEADIYKALAQFLGGVQHSPGPSALSSVVGLGKLGLSMFGAPGMGGGSPGGFVGGGSPSSLNLGG